MWTQASIVDYLKQAGLDELLAERLSKDFLDSNGDVPYLATEAQKQWAGKWGTLSEALGKMVEFYKFDDTGKHRASEMLDFEKKRRSTPQLQNQPPDDSGDGRSTPEGARGATYVSNITIDGVQTPVRFADSQSQAKGEDLLRKLARAKSAAAR